MPQGLYNRSKILVVLPIVSLRPLSQSQGWRPHPSLQSVERAVEATYDQLIAAKQKEVVANTKAIEDKTERVDAIDQGGTGHCSCA